MREKKVSFGKTTVHEYDQISLEYDQESKIQESHNYNDFLLKLIKQKDYKGIKLLLKNIILILIGNLLMMKIMMILIYKT